MNIFRTAFRLTLPVLGAYWFMGITYGLLAASLGYSIWIHRCFSYMLISFWTSTVYHTLGLWYVGDLLSERYRHPFSSPFCSKALCHYCLYSSSSLATQYASHHCWWHHLLHDFTPILIIFFHLSFRYLNKKA